MSPFAHSSGPRDAKLVFVGEAHGKEEQAFLPSPVPFVGYTGRELFRMIFEAMSCDPDLETQCRSLMLDYGAGWISFRNKWLQSAGVLVTNVFTLQPVGNQIETLCGKKAEVGNNYSHPPLKQGSYIKPEYLVHVERLRQELEAIRPNLVVALGNVATWALLGRSGITSIRGTVTEGPLVRGLKVLPTFHPSAVARDWAKRPIVLADLMKAQRERSFPEIIRPERTVLISPTLAEIWAWVKETLARPPRWLSCDIETGQRRIEMVGFSRSRSDSIVIPFANPDGSSYWPEASQEVEAWNAVRTLLESPIPKLGQNFLYDLQYLTRMGIRPWNCADDTMLLSHALYPEMPKGLGFLGSIHTGEASWKLMNRHVSTKKDE